MRTQLLLVDGYNMIGAWPELVALKNKDRMADARDLLLFQLSNYAKYEGFKVIVVFDAQFVPGIQQEYEQYELSVVFTKTGETADTYIERAAGELANRVTQVTVATSDLAEQWLVFSKGALRKSANELYKDLAQTKDKISQETVDYRLGNFRRKGTFSLKQLRDLEKLRNELSED